MKKSAFTCLILILLVVFTMGMALGTAENMEDLEKSIPDSAKDVLSGTDAENMDSALDKIIGYIKDEAGGIFADALKNGAAVMLIPVICSLAAALYDDKLPDVITIVGALAIAAMCLRGTGSFIGLGQDLLDELDSFSKVLLPGLTTAAAVSGAVTSAAAKYAASALFIEILISVGRSIVLPLIYAYIATSIGGAALGGGLESASKLIKWAAVTALTTLVLVFTVYLTVTGLISGTADAAATRLAKTALSTALPVVGGIISDAAASVVSGTSMLKNSIGVFGMIVVLAVCIIPFMRLGMSYLIFKGAAALSEPMGDGKLSKVINAVGTAMGMMLGLCGSMAVMLYISIISIMKVVT